MKSKTLLKVAISASLGALIGVSLGKYVSDHPFFLTLFALFGALCAFVLTRPKDFFLDIKNSMKIRFESRRRSKEIFRKRYEPLKEEHKLYRRNERLESSCVMFVLFWSLSPLVLISMEDESWTVFFQVIFAILAVISIVAFFSASAFCSAKDFVNNHHDIFTSQKDQRIRIEKLKRKVKSRKILFLKFAFMPLMAVWLPIKYFSFWTKSMAIIFAKACRVIVASEGWSAAMGAVLGFFVGWLNGRDEFLAMACGAIFGGCFYVLTMFLLKFLPDPDSEFPSPIQVKG
jgi:hypothetical protein